MTRPRLPAPAVAGALRLPCVLFASLLASCHGVVGEPGASDPESPPIEPLPTPGEPGLEAAEQLGLRRLSLAEYHEALRFLLGETTRPADALWPEDPRTPFDNDFLKQDPSSALVLAAETVANGVVDRALADPPRRAAIVGCTPASAGDATCMRDFIARFGRRALRRPLATEEVDAYFTLATAFTSTEGDFYEGVNVVVRALLQDVEFLYRVEIGAPVAGRPGLFALGGFEIATRLSFLLWGGPPDDSLLDAAAAGELSDAAGVRAAAEAMLSDPRARRQIDRIHALWFGYETLPHPPELTRAMRNESAALVQRIVLDDRAPWFDLFSETETYLDDTLAAHYGLPAPGGEGWVDYGDSGRAGLFSHGSFLGAGMVTGDTDPVRRGLYVRRQILCEDVPPPPAGVNANPQPPGDGECKTDWYANHRQGECAGCHRYFDPIGFGLEQFDAAGRYRTAEPARPSCAIAGDGELVPAGTFHGPTGLGELVADYEPFRSCVARRVYQYALGREPSPQGQVLVDWLRDRFAASERFDELVLDLVSHPSFVHRMEEGT